MTDGHESHQLHNDVPNASGEFSLESILREFGTPQTEQPSQTPPAEPKSPPKPPESPPSKPPVQPLSSSGTKKFKPVVPPSASVPSGTKRLPNVSAAVRTPPKPQRSITPLPAADAAPSVPQTPPKKSLSGIGQMPLRTALLLPIALLTFFLSEIELLPFSWAGSLPLAPRIWLTVILFTLTMLLALEVNIRGMSDLVHLRMGLFPPAVFVAVLSLIQLLLNRSERAQNFCPIVIFLYYFLMRSECCERNAFRRTLSTAEAFSAPMGVFDTPQLIKDTASLRRDPGKIEDFRTHLFDSDRPQKVFRVYGWCIIALTGLTAGAFSCFFDRSFVFCWLVLLLASIPFCGAAAFSRPFARLSKQLSSLNGALCGWYGAKILGGKHTIILRDEDLFPTGNISCNGMKIYNSYRADRVIAYARAALNAANSPLVDLFETLLQSRLGSHYPVADRRFYDIGGIGAEIFDDIILVGSLRFMRSMGVHMPEGARVRLAVYVSVNGELAGVFALKYKPNHSTKTGLRNILANRNFNVVLATRDFLITPELIAAKYALSTDSIRFPDYRERLRLSDRVPGESRRQGALIAKDTFGAFATTVAAGRTLRISSLFSMAISLFSGILGLLLCAMLLLKDGASVLTPQNVLLFQLIWALVNSFLTLLLLV